MRSLPPLFVVLAGTLVPSPGLSAAGEPPVIAAPATHKPSGHDTLYGRGTPRGVVLLALGSPSVELSLNFWIYRNYRSNQPAANRARYDTLVVTFEADRVSELRLVDGRALQALLASRKQIMATDGPSPPAGPRTAQRAP